jgi:hypothetical protein
MSPADAAEDRGAYEETILRAAADRLPLVAARHAPSPVFLAYWRDPRRFHLRLRYVAAPNLETRSRWMNGLVGRGYRVCYWPA